MVAVTPTPLTMLAVDKIKIAINNKTRSFETPIFIVISLPSNRVVSK
jgi:hypothetical protein